MLHDRIQVLVKYVADVIAGKCDECVAEYRRIYILVAGQAVKDHATLRSLSALVASHKKNPE